MTRALALSACLGLLTLGCGEHHEEHEKVPYKPMPMSGQLKPLGKSLGDPPAPLGHVKPGGPGAYVWPGVAQAGQLDSTDPALSTGEPE